MFAAQDGSTPNGKLYVDDVFSTYLYTGNGSTQTINNGIDLAGKGGLVWIKRRDAGFAHTLFDTVRGVNNNISSDSTAAQANNPGTLTAFNSNGFSLGSDPNNQGVNAGSPVSWTFRKAPKFFDVVTYTGNGVAGRTIAHSLESRPGCVIIKRTSGADNGRGNWMVWHVWMDGSSDRYNLLLNATGGSTGNASNENFGQVRVESTGQFRIVINDGESVNQNGATYVAYLFAHDPSADGIIQCGSFTSGTSSVNLGWEPQWMLVKNATAATDWQIFDSMRGFPTGTAAGRGQVQLKPNSPEAESATAGIGPNATGFDYNQGASNTFIYLAIRRPNKPPTTGTEVYSPVSIQHSGIGDEVFATGLPATKPVDMVFGRPRTLSTDWALMSRLLGYGLFSASNSSSPYLKTNSTDAVSSTGGPLWGFDNQTQVKTNDGNGLYIRNYHFFRRAPGFFDVVCYTGTGAARTVSHNLGVAPELMIVKGRNVSQSWAIYCATLGATQALYLNTTIEAGAQVSTSFWNDTSPTSSVFSVGNGNSTGAAYNYVAYLFASRPGISRVGSYTGNGTSQTINCGFTTGARFILIKRTDSTGDWYVWDSARGIVSANDPHLSLNTTAAEVTTDDSVDPDASGFIVNQNAATNINVSGGSYIFLAIA